MPDVFRYRFTGVEPEDFPAPPIARRLQPGDEFETDRPVQHARLEEIDENGDRIRTPFEIEQAAYEAQALAEAESPAATKPRTRKSAAEQPPASPSEE